MGLPKTDAERALDQMRDFFEPRLEALGLSVRDIQRQDIDELQRSLERVNDAIAHPESFGLLKLRMGTPSVLVSNRAEASIEVGVLPILLERKTLILQRIAEVRGDQKIETLRDLISQVPDPDLKMVLEKEVADLEAAKGYEQQAAQVEVQQERLFEQFEVEQRRERLRMEALERKSQVWRAFLERESVATVVGGVLLLILVAVLTVAMFTDVAASDVISNSFLLILGYFFGQTVARDAPRGAEAGQSTQLP